MLEDYEPIATGRTASLFEADMARHRPALEDAFGGARVAVIGAAGSIGSAVLRALLACRPGALALIDLSENGLVELVRDLRSGPGPQPPEDFEALPIGLGSRECARFFRQAPPFDYILNLAALKHVRSEKNVYCLMRMFDTNLLFVAELLAGLPTPPKKFFAVSSDKATRPASLMGASKRLMEEMLRAGPLPFSSARFANVAFSEGSLPRGMLRRIARRQPLAAPRDLRRYFMSHREAGEICLLACALGGHGDIFCPRLQAGRDERRFDEIARALIEREGCTPLECDSDAEARERAPEAIPRGQWPVRFFDSDTSGEKASEEFFADTDTLRHEGFEKITVIENTPPDSAARERIEAFLDFARQAREEDRSSQADYLAAVARALPDFHHIARPARLDDRL